VSGADGGGRSILLVSYFYPPTRDTGARRPAALAKYLARLGHRVTVLTTAAFGGDGSEATVPGVDVMRAADLQALRARIAGHERIESLFDADTYSGKPHPLSYLVVPEPLRVAWAPFARREALRAHRLTPFDAVLTTSPPESTHLIGRALQRRGVPWVADVRDAWTFEPLRPRFPLSLQRRADERLERRLLGAAERVVCVSEPAAADLRGRGIAEPLVIPNAWDPDNEPSRAAVAATAKLLDPERISLVYTGRFGSYGRDPRPLAEALGRLGAEAPETAARLELAIAGPLREEERALFEALAEGPARVSLLGSLERERSLALQRNADALLLIAQPTRSQLINFKLFEYLAARRPILALCAGTEAARILAEGSPPAAIAADDPAAIMAALSDVAARLLTEPNSALATRHSYPAAAEAVAAALEEAIAKRGAASKAPI
jgi:glycosyltransferase involved in cell wall biosynthesis